MSCLFRHAAHILLALCATQLLAAAPPVTVTTAESRDIVRDVRISGTVTSPRAALLSPSVGGLIAEYRVGAGDIANKGDVLVILDKELESLELERAAAAAAEARAALEDARRRLEEAERLGSEKGISESEIKSRRAEVEIRSAALQAATADEHQQRARVARHEIRSPFDGVVSERMAEVGEWINPGDSLLSLVATDGLRFDFRVPQEFYPLIDKTTDATLQLDALPEASFPGTIQAIVPVSDPGARSFLLRILPAMDELPAIIPGMSARAILHIDTGRTNVVVPRDALIRYPDGRTTVWVVVDEDGKAVTHERLVQTGLEFGGHIEIRDGITTDARVVTRGNESLQDGQAVSITERASGN